MQDQLPEHYNILQHYESLGYENIIEEVLLEHYNILHDIVVEILPLL